ncbi:MAG: extracellular solute-binding protein [Succinivibrio sp.]
MKKVIAVLTAAVITTISFNCSAKEKLVIWEDIGRSSTIEHSVKAFEEIADCEIVVKELPMYNQVSSLALKGPKGEGPDIVVLASDMVGLAKDRDLLSPIDFMQVEANQYLPNSVQSLVFDGQLYAVPKTIETLIVFYNKDLMSEPPLTLEEYISLSKEQRKKGRFGILAKWELFYTTFALMHGYGSCIFNSDNDSFLEMATCGLESRGSEEALSLVRRMYKEGLIYDYLSGVNGYNRMYELFTQGKALAVINGPWAIDDYIKAGVNIGLTTLPILPNGNPMAGFLGTKGYSISKWSNNQELAEEFLRFINTHEQAMARYKLSRQIPPVLSVLQDSSLANDELIQVIAQQSTLAVNMPSAPEMTFVWEIMDKALWSVIHTDKEIDNILEDAKDLIEKRVKEKDQF